MNELTAEIVVVGGGPAGLAAAAAASRSASVVVLDNNPFPGGQIWRAAKGRQHSRRAKRLLIETKERNVRSINQAEVFAAPDKESVLFRAPESTSKITFGKLIIATGARERFLPFPGWTLPGVFGAGGLQALVKGGLPIEGKRVVVAGTGPLLLAVAHYLRRKGAKIVGIVEQAQRSAINRLAVNMLTSPIKAIEAARLRAQLLLTPYMSNGWPVSVNGGESVESVTIEQNGQLVVLECDYLACGFHLIPNIELADLFGCETGEGRVIVDRFQRTSVENIFCAGEPTGIAGLESALVEGEIAGHASTGKFDEAKALSARRDRAREFGFLLDRTFKLRDELRLLPKQDTIICRCEDVRLGELEIFDDSREAKLQTRCGMGWCQGRICGPAGEFLFGWKRGTVRPPLFPVKMGDL